MDLLQSTAYNRSFQLRTSAGVPVTGATVTVKLTKNGGALGAAAGPVTEVSGGWYFCAFTAADTGTLGDLGVDISSTGGSGTSVPFGFTDQVRSQIITSIALDASGNVKVASNFKQNTALNLFFTMTINGVATPGAVVTGTRDFGSGFSPIAGAVSDRGNGTYMCALQPVDTNSPSFLWRFIAPGFDDKDISGFTTP
jgi:hypothetical protein